MDHSGHLVNQHRLSEISIGPNLDCTVSGLQQILFNFYLETDCESLQNLGSGRIWTNLMEKKCDIFVVKKMHFSSFLGFIWTWTLRLKIFGIVIGLVLSLDKSGLDLDRKIWQSAHLCRLSLFQKRWKTTAGDKISTVRKINKHSTWWNKFAGESACLFRHMTDRI